MLLPDVFVARSSAYLYVDTFAVSRLDLGPDSRASPRKHFFEWLLALATVVFDQFAIKSVA